MKCRRNFENNKGQIDIVWFGSVGIDELGHAKFYNDSTNVKYVNNIKKINVSSFENLPTIGEYDTAYVINNIEYFYTDLVDSHYLIFTDIQDMIKNLYNMDTILISTVQELNTFLANKRGKNYSIKQEGVKDSLIQRLSVLKGELWYKYSYGLPLLDKIRNKGIYDAIILDIINDHPDVTGVSIFKSTLINHTYNFSFTATTIYNSDINTNISLGN